MIYIVTDSDFYYPSSGANDWELVTRDREGALERAAGLSKPHHAVYVLAINEDNLHVREVVCHD